MQETKKISLWEMLKIAVAEPKNYHKVNGVSRVKLVLFIFLINAIITFLGIAVPMISFGISIGGGEHFITETLPPFEYKDGSFSIEDRVAIDYNGVRIIADDEVESFSKDDFDDEQLMEVLISKNNMIMKNSMVGENMNVDFKTAGEGTFNNEDLAELLPLFYLGLIVALVTVWITNLASYGFSSIVFGFFGVSFARIHGKNIPFKQMLRYAVLAKVTAAIIVSMGTAAGIGFVTSYMGSTIEIMIIFGYLFFAIKSHRTAGVE